MLRHGRRVQKRLPPFLLDSLDLIENVGEVLLYRRIGEHAIGLIQHQELQVAQVLAEPKLIVLQLMYKTAWRAYNYMWDLM